MIVDGWFVVDLYYYINCVDEKMYIKCVKVCGIVIFIVLMSELIYCIVEIIV